MASRLDPVWAAVDGWRWPVAAPVGLVVGVGVGVGALAVGGWVGVGFGALAAAAFGWLAAQGEAWTEVEEEDPAGLVGRWGRERAIVMRAVGARWVARLREAWAVGARWAVRVADGERSSGGALTSVYWPERAQGHVGAIVNLSLDRLVVLMEETPNGTGPDLLGRGAVQLGDVPPLSAWWLTDAQARDAAPWLAVAMRSSVCQWYGPDLPGLPPNPLAKEEVEDGPPLEPALFVRRRRRSDLSDPLRPVTTPTDTWDTLGPMKDLPGGWLQSESWPEGTDVESFRLMTLPVTEALWAEVMGERRGRWQFGQAPVTLVSWFDAVAFCNRASELAGYTPAYDAEGRWLPEADGYRLPTDAEWEWACRAGTTTTFHWGGDEQGADAHAWFDGNAGDRANAVGRKRPNPWGLYDLTGNVWEWCTSAVDGRQVVDNPTAVSTREVARVLRGGAFGNGAWYLRSSFRLRFEPSNEFRYFGFRCARGVRRQLPVDP